MSGANPPSSSSRKSFRKRFLVPVRSLIHSTTLPPPVLPATAIPQNPLLSTTSAAGPPTSLPHLLRESLLRLSEQDRVTLQQCNPTTSSSIDTSLDQALAAAQQLQQLHQGKRWTFTLGSRTLTLQEEVDKVVQWLDRFKSAGDIIANVDPIHIGLPWAGIRLLLEGAVGSMEQQHSIVVGLEMALYMSNRLRAYMEFYSRLNQTQARENFEQALVVLQAQILGFLAQTIRVYQTSIIRRTVDAFLNSTEIVNFETRCDRLATRVEIEASNCDRDVFEQSMQQTVQEIRKLHCLHDLMNRVEAKIDFNSIPYAKGAEFDSYGLNHRTCHPDTRADVLRHIQDWIRQPDAKHIFWLNGAAGTGKSTIACTVAQWVSGLGRHQPVRLGASFFFKRGTADRSSPALFFPTIVRQLVRSVEGLDALVAQAINSNADIGTKLLGEQFDRLIFEPLQLLPIDLSQPRPVVVVVVDALDECDDGMAIRAIIDLWSKAIQTSSIDLKLFLTSRPDLPVKRGFHDISIDLHLDMDLYRAVAPGVIRHDILAFLKDELLKVRQENLKLNIQSSLPHDWPGDETLHVLTDIAMPLFIVAATICRFVGDILWDPQEQLDRVLKFNGVGEQMEQTYLPVLMLFSASAQDLYEKDRLHQEFREIIGSIILLAEPLSVPALATLLNRPSSHVVRRLLSLHSVLHIPVGGKDPVQTLHLSFREFLLSSRLDGQPCKIHGPSTHRMLLERCLDLLSSGKDFKLRENVCRLKYPAQLRTDIDVGVTHKYLPSPVQYACRYWVFHAQQSGIKLRDDDIAHRFLRTHFLHWFEALILMGDSTKAVGFVSDLQSILMIDRSDRLATFLEDARRFALCNRHVGDLAPLQLYSSAIMFSPQRSSIRNICGHLPPWISQAPPTPLTWSPELLTLEGHTDDVKLVVFSPHGGRLLATGSDDCTIRVWDSRTGQEVQQFQKHREPIASLVFSPHDSNILASGSYHRTIQLWNIHTGQEELVCQFRDEAAFVGHLIAFSPHDPDVLALSSTDSSIRLLCISTGQKLQELKGHDFGVLSMIFSPHHPDLLASAAHDGTIRLWSIRTGKSVQQFAVPKLSFPAMDFSPHNSDILATVAREAKLTLWSVSTGQAVQHFQIPFKTWMLSAALASVAFSPSDSSLVATGSISGKVLLWDIVTGCKVREFGGGSDTVQSLAFSPGGNLLASAAGRQPVRIWNPNCEVGRDDTDRSWSDVKALAFSPTGENLLLVSTTFARSINKITGREMRRAALQELRKPNMGFRLPAYCYISHDATIIASIESLHWIILMQLGGAPSTIFMRPETEWLEDCIFSPNDKLLASRTSGGMIYVWELGTVRHSLYTLGTSTDTISAYTFSPDNKLLASASGHHGWLSIWDIHEEKTIQTLNGAGYKVSGVAFSFDGEFLASCSVDDREIILWRLSTASRIWRSERSTRTVSFTTDGQDLMTDRGYLSIDPNILSSYTSMKITTGTTAKTSRRPLIQINGEWITSDGENLLWLPYEYRDCPHAIHDNTIAFGLDSEDVRFMTLDYPRQTEVD